MTSPCFHFLTYVEQFHKMLSHDKDSPGDLHRYLVVLFRGWLFLGIFILGKTVGSIL